MSDITPIAEIYGYYFEQAACHFQQDAEFLYKTTKSGKLQLKVYLALLTHKPGFFPAPITGFAGFPFVMQFFTARDPKL